MFMYSYCYLYVFLLLRLCILIVMYVPFCIHVFCFHHASWHSSATLTEVFPCIFLSCKANGRVFLAKTGHVSALFLIGVIVLFNVLFVSILLFSVFLVCICVLYYCHRVSTQLQLNISYHIVSYHIILYHIKLPLLISCFNTHISYNFFLLLWNSPCRE
jgi:hypothetical protein